MADTLKPLTETVRGPVITTSDPDIDDARTAYNVQWMPAPPGQILFGLRVAIGAGAWAAPNRSGRLFGLDPVANPQGAFIGRLFGIRELALGIGTNATSGPSRRVWWQLGVACDLADAAAAVLAARNGTLPKAAAVMTGAIALGAAVLGVAALTSDDAI